jgi:hypothetical protein
MTAARPHAPQKPQRDWLLILAAIGTGLLVALAIASAVHALP